MRSIPSMYLSPLGAGTRIQLIIRLAVITHKVTEFIADLANKRILLVRIRCLHLGSLVVVEK
jgi:hypothetical protein